MEISDLSVIVVEDDNVQRRVLLRWLQDLGVEETRHCPNGRAALDMLMQSPLTPDIAIVDLDMPEMDGIELIRHLANGRFVRAIIIASGMETALLTSVEHMARGYGLQVLGNVQKPVMRERLAALLRLYDAQAAARPSAPAPPVNFTAQDLHHALEAEEFVPAYQPQVEIGTGRLIGCEMLIRWQRAGEERPVLPSFFLPMLEREGLVSKLTNRCLELAATQQALWAMDGFHIGMSINVSMLDLSDLDSVDRYADIVRRRGVDPRCLTLEVTETQVMAQAPKVLDVLARLRLKGFSLSIDDFGTGYSSLQQLSQIPVSELKIYGGFVRHCERDARQRAIVESSIKLAQRLKLRVVAEGVETLAEWNMLKCLGCDLAQGWLMAPAMFADDFAKWATSYEPPGG